MSTYKSDAESLQSKYKNTSPPECSETSQRINTALQRIIALGAVLDRYSSEPANNGGFFGNRDQLMKAFQAVQASNKSLINKGDSARHTMVDEIVSVGGDYCSTSLGKLGFGSPQ
ncbi:uncharacterized protein H6S33_010969 [Morchella sextelata]|jgi:hypothetical protein|uniref:uncharacterized protein n=1 Tax=Morchella sextelata TaxID=1174677 RepID=UPI001D05898C|nr:uncharacterized protein H6S33_010969 [Morchella sextelata]KAH0611704.1 hypothetical protein H6S33_010969 [Morchella sextelata]